MKVVETSISLSNGVICESSEEEIIVSGVDVDVLGVAIASVSIIEKPPFYLVFMQLPIIKKFAQKKVGDWQAENQQNIQQIRRQIEGINQNLVKKVNNVNTDIDTKNRNIAGEFEQITGRWENILENKAKKVQKLLNIKEKLVDIERYEREAKKIAITNQNNHTNIGDHINQILTQIDQECSQIGFNREKWNLDKLDEETDRLTKLETDKINDEDFNLTKDDYEAFNKLLDLYLRIARFYLCLTLKKSPQYKTGFVREKPSQDDSRILTDEYLINGLIPARFRDIVDGYISPLYLQEPEFFSFINRDHQLELKENIERFISQPDNSKLMAIFDFSKLIETLIDFKHQPDNSNS